MNFLFEPLHLTVTTPDRGKKLEYLTISNPDGSPRWMVPSHVTSPLYLRFYHVEGFRSQVFALMSKFIFLLRIQTLVYRKEIVYLRPDSSGAQPVVNLWDAPWALFTGTAGPNRKMVLHVADSECPTFFKIPISHPSAAMVRQEWIGSLKAGSIEPETFRIPVVRMLDHGVLESRDIGTEGYRSNQFTQEHRAAIEEMARKTAHESVVGKSSCFQKSAELLDQTILRQDSRIPSALFDKLKQMETRLSQKTMVSALNHGDFTPWNMMLSDGMLDIYDWELSGLAYPLGFDAHHFIIQKGILIDRKPWVDIRSELSTQLDAWGVRLAMEFNTDWTLYLDLYLYVNISTQLELFSRQPNWHTQVNWMMDTWTQALSDVLCDVNEHRGMVIEDVIGHLTNIPYATIKFPERAPSSLDPYSDIDMCLRESDAESVIELLKHHPLTVSIRVKKTSFMATVHVGFKNREVLNLDLIHQLKWKHLEMMSVDEVLSRARENAFGVKEMHPNDLVLYLGLFYGLNGTMIPNRHQYYLTMATEPVGPLHQAILRSNRNGVVPKADLRQEIRRHPSNAGLRGWTNRLCYAMDTLRGFVGRKGLIVTFSGVDGAGKSTVIEHIRHEFDKKQRRNVVVIRHRPSILPILSAWTKGKAKAEQDAAQTLPRQGLNRNPLSSLFRFAYYYTDYLFGQFVIYVRHVMRGDLVLYDRYYFDFINDSVRSNIHLPKWMLRLGYSLLMKPDVNFFLYADADTILSRKRELDRETIIDLTQTYLRLFSELNGRSAVAPRYIAIENNDLNQTLDRMIDTISSKVGWP